MSFPNVISGSEGELFHNSIDETVPVGTKMIIEDGRAFRFTEAGGTALVVGNLNCTEAPSANYTTEVIDTISSGTNTLTGVGATGADFAIHVGINGYIYTDNATTLPLMRIKDNNVLSSGSTGSVFLYIKTPTDIAAGNTVSYFKNPWRDVIISATPPVGVLTGVCKVAITADQFGWSQTLGPATVLYDSDTTAIAAVGDPVVPSASGDSDGSVSGMADSTGDTNPTAGWQLGLVEGNGEQNAVFLVLE